MSEEKTEIKPKEREITVESKTRKTLDSGKNVWEVIDIDGVRFSFWSETVGGNLNDGVTAKVRYFEKKVGKYTNRTITAVSYKNADGKYGAWTEDTKSYGSSALQGRKFFGKSPEEQKTIATLSLISSFATLFQGKGNEDAVFSAVDKAQARYFKTQKTDVAITNGDKEQSQEAVPF